MKLDHRGLFSVRESQCRGVPWPQGTSGAGRHQTRTSCQVVSLKLQELSVCLASLGNLLEWLFIVEERLNTAIHGCWIGCDGLVLWPAMSSGLTSHDFFLWSYVKTQVFTDEVKIVDKPKRRIKRVVWTVTPAILSTKTEVAHFIGVKKEVPFKFDPNLWNYYANYQFFSRWAVLNFNALGQNLSVLFFQKFNSWTYYV